MASIHYIAGLEPEDLTAKQWLKLLKYGALRHSLKKGEEGRDEDTEEAAEENQKLVDLSEEKKGKSKAPEVQEDDLPEGVEVAEDKKPKKKKQS